MIASAGFNAARDGHVASPIVLVDQNETHGHARYRPAASSIRRPVTSADQVTLRRGRRSQHGRAGCRRDIEDRDVRSPHRAGDRPARVTPPMSMGNGVSTGWPRSASARTTLVPLISQPAAAAFRRSFQCACRAVSMQEE
jgi:hypothetical protein